MQEIIFPADHADFADDIHETKSALTLGESA